MTDHIENDASAKTITVSVNGNTFATQHTLLGDLLQTLDTGNMFAVAHNGEFVPKSQHSATTIADGDTLDIVTPVGGG